MKKSAITSSDLRSYFASINGDLRAVRDRSIPTTGLAGAFRRSELAALRVEDLEETAEGYRVTVRRSKTDQEGRGRVKVIVYGQNQGTCPVLLLRTWLARQGSNRVRCIARSIEAVVSDLMDSPAVLLPMS